MPGSLQIYAPPHLAHEAELLAAKNRELSGSLFATSGTTGTPQWILHSQDSLDWCARTVNEHFACTTADVWGLALPEFHVGGYCLTHRAKLAKGRLARFPERWNTPQFHHWLTEENVTLTSLVPTQLFDLVQANLKCPPNLRIALIGGEHLSQATFEKARELAWPLVTSYGMTETAGLIAASQVHQRELHPLPGWQLTTTSQDRLTIDGPGLFQGHLSETGFQSASHPFITKDLVELKNNTLAIQGRSDDQIKILGELVDLAHLRKSLAAILPNHRSTLLAFPENRRGHLLVPVIESVPNDELRKQIAAWNATLPPFSRCHEPFFFMEWPSTPLGKVNYLALKKEIANERTSLLQKRPPQA